MIDRNQEVKKVEDIANQMIDKNQEMFAKEAPLAVAKTIQGLRAVFDETYPDPVRVVSIGIPVETLESNPTDPAGAKTSVEFCGGTHLKRAGDIGHFVISSEEAIAKGIRRVIALTGPEADKAIKKADLLEANLAKVAETIKSSSSQLGQKEMVKLITDLGDDISGAQIAYWKKDEMRNKLKALKKAIDDQDRARKAAVMTEVVEVAKALCAANKDQAAFIVYELNAFAQNKALDGALKQVKAICPSVPAIFFSSDPDAGKVLCMAQVSKEVIAAKGLKANEWCGEVQKLINGKGGGKPENAQASGTNVAGMPDAMAAAVKYACAKLNVAEPVLVQPGPIAPSAPAPAAGAAAAAGGDKAAKKKAAPKSKDGEEKKSSRSFSGSPLLHGRKDSPLTKTVLIAASYLKAKKMELVESTLEGLKLEHQEGQFLEGHSAILTYLMASKNNESGCCPDNDAELAQTLQWVFHAANDVYPMVCTMVLAADDAAKKKAAGVEASRRLVKDCLDKVNAMLMGKTYLVGERIGVADVAMCMVLLPVKMMEGEEAFKKAHGNVNRWINTLTNQPEFKQVLES